MKNLHVLLLLAAVLQIGMACASMPPKAELTHEENTCQVYTAANAEMCDPDGDIANGDYDAAE